MSNHRNSIKFDHQNIDWEKAFLWDEIIDEKNK